jgi:hypothetical protein
VGRTPFFDRLPLGNVTVSEDNPAAAGGRGRITRRSYDATGKLERIEIAADPDSPFETREIFTYAVTVR